MTDLLLGSTTAKQMTQSSSAGSVKMLVDLNSPRVANRGVDMFCLLVQNTAKKYGSPLANAELTRAAGR